MNHGEALEVTALRSTLQAGAEILNYYGPLPTSELLRRYGYTTPEHQRYDIVEIPWTLARKILQDHLELSDDRWNQLVGSCLFPSTFWPGLTDLVPISNLE